MTIDYATYYVERCKEASMDQGIDVLIQELDKLGIHATSEQTGGFTMCAYIPLSDDQYIYANSYSAGLYGKEDFIKDIYLNDDQEDRQLRVADLARAINEWIKENK
jgi:hypothetical protein